MKTKKMEKSPEFQDAHLVDTVLRKTKEIIDTNWEAITGKEPVGDTYEWYLTSLFDTTMRLIHTVEKGTLK